MSSINLFWLVLGFILVSSKRYVWTLETESIVGGEEAQLGWFPYQVSVENLEFSLCGGVIVTEWHVVTAAHCVIDEDNNFVDFPLKIVAGIVQLDSNPPSKVVKWVERIYALKLFNRRNQYPNIPGDVAVLKLKEPLYLDGKYLRALKIPEKITYVNQKAIVTGFGVNWVKTRTTFDGQKMEGEQFTSGRLRWAEAIVLSNAECQKQYKSLITEFHLCAQIIQRKPDVPEGVCSGDSGSPLVYDHVRLIGILSASPKGCQERNAGAIYTRVSFYVDFINMAIAGNLDINMRRSEVLPS